MNTNVNQYKSFIVILFLQLYTILCLCYNIQCLLQYRYYSMLANSYNMLVKSYNMLVKSYNMLVKSYNMLVKCYNMLVKVGFFLVSMHLSHSRRASFSDLRALSFAFRVPNAADFVYKLLYKILYKGNLVGRVCNSLKEC